MTTYSDTQTDLVINRLTKTQFDGATGLDPAQCYEVDPEFSGNKLLQTSADGDIIESDESPLTIQALSATDSITLADNYCYQGGEQTSLTIALPASATVGFVAQITFKSGATPTAITVPQTGFVWDKRGEDVAYDATVQKYIFTAVANRYYTFVIGYNGYSFVGYSSGV